MMNTLARWVPIAAMLFLMGAGLLMMAQLLGGGRAFRQNIPTSLAEATDGEWTRNIEDELEREVLIRKPSIHLFNAVSYLLFGEARSGVLVGSDGWLFSREEFDWSAESRDNLEAAMAAVSRAVSALHSRGVKVALAFIPAKSDIYQDRLSRYILPQSASTLYARVLELAAATGADAVPDLAGDLRAARAQAEVFLHTDTHWSVFGAGRAAASLCALEGPLLSNKVNFSVSVQASAAHRGDLLNFLELGRFNSMLAMNVELVTPIAAAQEIDAANPLNALFGDSATDALGVALVGTSYSANPLWSFGDQIKIACQSDLVAFAMDGEGPFEPMASYLSAMAETQAVLPELVIWEIPVRYLDDYSSEELTALY